jgi:hypothetical protein
MVFRSDAVGIVEIDRRATRDGDADSCAVAEGTADQQVTHATVAASVDRH